MLSARALSVGHPGAAAGPPMDLDLAAGEWVALSGPNGAGKSALLLTLAGLLPARGGLLQWKGGPLADSPPARRSIGIALQDFEAQLITDSVAAEIALPLEHLGWPRASIQARVAELLSEFDLAHLSLRSPSQLSGGEQARLAIAAAAAAGPELLLLDEPEASLDARYRAWLLGWLERRSHAGHSTLVATQLPEYWRAAARRLWLDPRGLTERERAEGLGAAPVAAASAAVRRAGDLTFVSSHEARAEETETLLHLEAVSFRHPAAAGEAWLLENVDLRLSSGETLLVRGPNGSGKTTLLALAAGLLEPTRGRARPGTALLAIAPESRLGILLQSPEDQLVGETVLEDLGLFPGRRRRHRGRGHERERARAALSAVGLPGEGLLARSPADLSAGERRRVAWAGLLVMECRVWVLDEPTAGLDEAGVELLASAIKRFNRSGGAALVATQDDRLASRIGSVNSPVAAGLTSETVSGRPLPQPPSREMALDLDRT